MTADEMRKRCKALYETILGRNYYSQNGEKRQCVYTPYSDGKYYSDCSSSILNTFYKAGAIAWKEGNTATIHTKGFKVLVDIMDGIPDESQLRIGDCLLFRGSDPSRPLQIGHVEMYAGNNTLYGHGSNTPSVKDMHSYCEYRQRQKASNGLSKGLVEVRRFVLDDDVETPIQGNLECLAALNYRSIPHASGELLGTFKQGEIVPVDKKSNRWFHVPGKGWCSAKYLTGWVLEGKWWYLEPGYTYPVKCIKDIGGKEYAFDRDGWMIDRERIAESGEILYN
jgi:hypothetical protein